MKSKLGWIIGGAIALILIFTGVSKSGEFEYTNAGAGFSVYDDYAGVGANFETRYKAGENLAINLNADAYWFKSDDYEVRDYNLELFGRYNLYQIHGGLYLAAEYENDTDSRWYGGGFGKDFGPVSLEACLVRADSRGIFAYDEVGYRTSKVDTSENYPKFNMRLEHNFGPLTFRHSSGYLHYGVEDFYGEINGLIDTDTKLLYHMNRDENEGLGFFQEFGLDYDGISETWKKKFLTGIIFSL